MKGSLEGIRDNIAALIGTLYGESIFTNGGTEADNFAIKGLEVIGRYAYHK